MARINDLTNFLTDVAGAIKTKKGVGTNIAAEDFDTEILALPSQGTYQTKSVTITSNGTTVIEPSSGYDAMDQIDLVIDVEDTEYNTDLSLSEDILGEDTTLYEKLEYIESTGTQYIDTGFLPTDKTEFDFTFNKDTSNGFSTYEQAFGVRQSGGSYWINCVGLFYYIYNARKISYYNNRGEQNQYSFNMYDTKVRFISNGTSATLTNLSTGTTQTIQTTEKTNANYSLYIFAGRTASNTVSDPSKYFKIYEFKIYNDGTLVRYFIPVRRKSDNVICMYDRVTRQFYTNRGSGTFIAGPTKS